VALQVPLSGPINQRIKTEFAFGRLITRITPFICERALVVMLSASRHMCS